MKGKRTTTAIDLEKRKRIQKEREREKEERDGPEGDHVEENHGAEVEAATEEVREERSDAEVVSGKLLARQVNYNNIKLKKVITRLF